MINDDNRKVVHPASHHPLHIHALSEHGSFACRRPVGEGYYNEKENITYVCWNERGMDIYLNTFHHGLQAWGKPQCIASLQLFGRWDYHDYVTMVPHQDGQPMLFFNIHSIRMIQIKKNTDGQWIQKTISHDRNCYSSPVRYRDTIYIFYSQNKDITHPYRPLRYIKSTDDGESWSLPVTIIDSQKKAPLCHDEIYQCGCELAEATNCWPDRILISWTMWGGPKHAAQGQGAYCAVFSLEDEQMYDVNGQLIGPCIGYEDMRRICLIEEAPYTPVERHNVFGVMVQPLECGKPIVAYGMYHDGVYALKTAEYNNNAWVISVVSETAYNIKDMHQHDGVLTMAVCEGDAVVLYRRNRNEQNFHILSITKIPHHNNSDSVPYLNFVHGSTNRCSLMLGLIERDHIDAYYEGKWPVYYLSEN